MYMPLPEYFQLPAEEVVRISDSVARDWNTKANVLLGLNPPLTPSSIAEMQDLIDGVPHVLDQLVRAQSEVGITREQRLELKDAWERFGLQTEGRVKRLQKLIDDSRVTVGGIPAQLGNVPANPNVAPAAPNPNVLPANFQIELDRFNAFKVSIPASSDRVKALGVTPEQVLKLRNELSTIYVEMSQNGFFAASSNDFVNRTIEQIQKEYEIYKNLLDSYQQEQPATSMTVDEIVTELTTVSTRDDQRSISLLNAFDNKSNALEDGSKKSRLIVLVSSMAAFYKAGSSTPDFATNLEAVWQPFSERGGTLQRIAEALFFKKPNDQEYKLDEINDPSSGVEVRTETIELWRYMVKRIKHDKKKGGLSSAVRIDTSTNPPTLVDNTGLLPIKHLESFQHYQTRLAEIQRSDGDFSYNALKEQVVGKFEKHLRLIFSDLDKQLFDTALVFMKSFGAKSSAYMPHLLRGTTRSHGAKLRTPSSEDESAYVNPFALRMYQATRYNTVKRHRFMSRFLYVPQSMYETILTDQSRDKLHPGKEFYKLMEEFYIAKYGQLPNWISSTRRYFEGPEPRISLNDNIFPVLPEMVVSVVEVEAKKRKLKNDALSSSGQALRRVANEVLSFFDEYYLLGYFQDSTTVNNTSYSIEVIVNALKSELQSNVSDQLLKNRMHQILNLCFGDSIIIAGDKSKNVDLTNYDLASKATKTMFDFFDTTVGEKISREQIREKMDVWRDKVIGKAKLVPGKHQLFFAPFTAELLCTLLQAYKGAGDWNDVKQIYREEMESITSAKGLPAYAVSELLRILGGDNKPPDYVQVMYNQNKRNDYLRHLQEVNNEKREGVGAMFKRAVNSVNIALGDFDTPPYEYNEQVEKKVTKEAE